jgi:hypothetical protein
MFAIPTSSAVAAAALHWLMLHTAKYMLLLLL